MPAREVTLSERAAAVSIAATALDVAAQRWLDARAAGDRDRLRVVGPLLDGAVQDYRRASSALERTKKRLSRKEGDGGE
jgi:hypothetical protein